MKPRSEDAIISSEERQKGGTVPTSADD